VWAFLVGHEECALRGPVVCSRALSRGLVPGLQLCNSDWCLAYNSAIRLVPGLHFCNSVWCLACNSAIRFVPGLQSRNSHAAWLAISIESTCNLHFDQQHRIPFTRSQQSNRKSQIRPLCATVIDLTKPQIDFTNKTHKLNISFSIHFLRYANQLECHRRKAKTAAQKLQ